MKKFWTLIAALVFMAAAIQAQIYTPEWIRKANLIEGKRDRASAFAIGDYGYICLGLDSNNFVKQDLWQYDTLNDVWTQKADFPGIPRRDAIAFVLSGKAYVGTGIDDSSTTWGTTLNDMYMYDPTLNSWTAKMPYANGTKTTFRSVGLSANGMGYVIGGRTFNPIRDLWEYDPSADLWTEKTSMPMGDGRAGAIGFTLDGILYFGCGQDDNFYHNDLWSYDPSTDTWTELADIPGSERVSAIGFEYKGKGVVGLGSNGGYLGDFWSYDPDSDSWSYLNEFGGSDRRSAVSFSFGDKAYVYGGKASSGTKKDLWMLTDVLLVIDTIIEDTGTSTHLGLSPDESAVQFCNPVSSQNGFQITIPFDAHISILGLNGQCLGQYSLRQGAHYLPIYPIVGTYLLKIESMLGSERTYKVIFN